MQAVSTSDGPTGHDGDHDLRHCADQALYLKDVKTAGPPLLDRFSGLALGILIAALAADALIATRAEGPTPVLRGWTVSGDQDTADVGRHPGMIKASIQLVDRSRPERVAHLGPVEGNANGSLVYRSVVCDVGEFADVVDRRPASRVEQWGDRLVGHGGEARPGEGWRGRSATAELAGVGRRRVRTRCPSRQRLDRRRTPIGRVLTSDAGAGGGPPRSRPTVARTVVLDACGDQRVVVTRSRSSITASGVSGGSDPAMK